MLLPNVDPGYLRSAPETMDRFAKSVPNILPFLRRTWRISRGNGTQMCTLEILLRSLTAKGTDVGSLCRRFLSGTDIEHARPSSKMDIVETRDRGRIQSRSPRVRLMLVRMLLHRLLHQRPQLFIVWDKITLCMRDCSSYVSQCGISSKKLQN